MLGLILSLLVNLARLAAKSYYFLTPAGDAKNRTTLYDARYAPRLFSNM